MAENNVKSRHPQAETEGKGEGENEKRRGEEEERREEKIGERGVRFYGCGVQMGNFWRGGAGLMGVAACKKICNF